jgi:hypothetical protein
MALVIYNPLLVNKKSKSIDQVCGNDISKNATNLNDANRTRLWQIHTHERVTLVMNCSVTHTKDFFHPKREMRRAKYQLLLEVCLNYEASDAHSPLCYIRLRKKKKILRHSCLNPRKERDYYVGRVQHLKSVNIC